MPRHARSSGRPAAGRGPSRLARPSGRGGRTMIEAAMIWNEPNNKSHWDSEIDPDWSRFARDGDPRRAARSRTRTRRSPGCSAASRRSIRSSCATWPGSGVLDAGRRGRGARLPARLEPLADRRVAGEARGDRRGHRPAGLGHRGRRLHVRRRGGAGVRPRAHRRAADGPRAAHPLVQPLRPAAGVARDHPPPGGRGLVLLPALLHGPAARGRHARSRRSSASPPTPPSSASASGSTSRTTGSTTRVRG